MLIYVHNVLLVKNIWTKIITKITCLKNYLVNKSIFKKQKSFRNKTKITLGIDIVSIGILHGDKIIFTVLGINFNVVLTIIRLTMISIQSSLSIATIEGNSEKGSI